MKRSRLVRAVVSLLAVGALLTACSSLIPFVANMTEEANGASIVPVVGDCWNASFETIDVDSSWSKGRPVDCAMRHESYTYAVQKLSKKFTGPLIDTKTGLVRDEIDSAAGAACDTATAKFLPSLTVKETRLELGYFVPSEAAWSAGARWVRCDIAIIAFGSSFAAPELARLPAKIADFVHRAESTPRWIALCINTQETVNETDPFASGTATYADCEGAPQWRESSENDLPGGSSAPFPSDADRIAFGKEVCGNAADAAGQVWVTYEPTKETWLTGDRTVECWIAAEASAPPT